MAIKSTSCSRATRISSVAGSPIASSHSTCEAGAVEIAAEAIEVFAVAAHFFRLAQLQIVEVPRGPAIGDVDQQELRAGEPGEAAHVREDRAIRR